MARGQKVEPGARRVSQNGYDYTKMEDGAWRLTHHLVAEESLGRPLRNDERVSFVNGKKHDLRPENIRVTEKGTASVRRRLAQIEARINELQAEKHELEKELEAGRKVNHSR